MKAQRGIALITAVILVALATVIATAIAYSNSLNARRAAANFTSEQALYIAEGAEALAAYALRESLKSSLQTSPEQTWAMPYGPVEIENGVVIEAKMEDLQGRFNINNLVDGNGVADPVVREQFEQLLTRLQMDTRWAQKLIDWIDRDDVPTLPDGGEDSAYLSQTPAYRTPNLPVSSVSELLALPGFGRDNYDRLLPYITALPPGTPVNPCTASGLVLDAMAGRGQQEYGNDPEVFAGKRKSGCYPTVPQLQASMTTEQWQRIQTAPGGAARFGDTSFYFRLRSDITIGTVHFTVYSLIHREQGQIRPILRTFGTD
jgi:general secretion pathway protein K